MLSDPDQIFLRCKKPKRPRRVSLHRLIIVAGLTSAMCLSNSSTVSRKYLYVTLRRYQLTSLMSSRSRGSSNLFSNGRSRALCKPLSIRMAPKISPVAAVPLLVLESLSKYGTLHHPARILSSSWNRGPLLKWLPPSAAKTCWTSHC